MGLTLLDRYIGTCATNAQYMPVYKRMDEALKETAPVAHLWDYDGDTLLHPLPNRETHWPDPAMCVYTPKGMTNGLHTFCVDVGYAEGEFHTWFMRTTWTLEGLLLFQPNANSFDVIPLARESDRREIILPEVQLHYEFENGAWTWTWAYTGPVNALFHNYFVSLMDDDAQAAVHENIVHLGNVIHLYLGTYWNYLQHAGTWAIHPAKPAKVKRKGDRIVKVYKPGSAGYKTYEHKETDDASKASDA